MKRCSEYVNEGTEIGKQVTEDIKNKWIIQ